MAINPGPMDTAVDRDDTGIAILELEVQQGRETANRTMTSVTNAVPPLFPASSHCGSHCPGAWGLSFL